MRFLRMSWALVLLAGCNAQDNLQADASAAQSDSYQFTQASRDGIGKWYMGREISHVMGHLGAGWLERDEREQVERTDLLIENLPLRPDSVVADIGAGTGYFSFPVARRLPQGRVLAVDIQPEMLSIVRERSDASGVTNVEPVLGSISDPGLTPASVDLIFIVDAYHEFSHPLEMGRAMTAALKPGGQLVLIEYRGEDPNVPIKRLHKMTQAQAKAEMAAIGLRWVKTEDFLPQQHFMLFAK
jgi:precorrin-6B methylase 2